MASVAVLLGLLLPFCWLTCYFLGGNIDVR